jgi:type I restriction enzyme S subunit
MLVANDKIMHHFEKAAENIRTNILNLFSQIRHLTEARDRLLPKLMSGEINV